MGVVAMRTTARVISFAIVMTLVAGATAAPPAASAAVAAGTTLSETTLGAPSLDPKPVGLTSDLTATVTAGATGDVQFFDNDQLVATVPLNASSQAVYTVPGDATVGLHVITAEYQGDDTYAESEDSQDVTVGPRPASALVSSVSGRHDPTGAVAQKGDLLTVTVSVADAGVRGSIDPAGTVDVKVDNVTKATVTLPEATATIATAALALGNHDITAVYTPAGTDHSADTSPAFRVSLVANIVEAVQLAPTLSTFYPYRDGYRDTTSFRGRRDEAASVTVKIYSPANKLVRTLSVASKPGAWSVPWNGKNTAGTRVAAGKYKAIQSVNDGLTTRKLTPQYVTVSAKRIYTYTKTLKQSLAQRDAGSPAKGWVGWKFTLPSAKVYKKVVFGIYGKSGTPLSVFGPHDYSSCPSTTAWNWQCMGPYGYFSKSLAWRGVAGSTSYNRHGTTVRMYAIALNGRTSVGYARVVVTYGVLK